MGAVGTEISMSNQIPLIGMEVFPPSKVILSLFIAVNPEPTRIFSTAKMLTANKGRSRLGASVAVKFSQEFATQVSWQKVDERTGAEIPDEDIIDGGGDEPTPTPSGDDDLEG